MKVVFGILSANNPADIVQQTIDALGGDCDVIVHHDFGQRPDFVLTGENVWILEDPVRTAWGDWSLVEATLRLMRHALMNYQFDYFQLLSDSCLPIRTVFEFKEMLMLQRPDAMIDLIGVRDDKDVFLSHAYRCYTPSNTFFHRVFQRSRVWALGPGPHKLKKIAGIGVQLAQPAASPAARFKQFVGQSVTASLRACDLVASRPRTYVGSQWFCVSRSVCGYIVERARDERLVGYFSKLGCPDEIFFASVVGNSQFRRIEEANHATLWNRRGTGPEDLVEGDLPAILRSGKFFARKFPKQSDHAVRTAVLKRIALVAGEASENE